MNVERRVGVWLVGGRGSVATTAMTGAAAYFVMSADDSSGIPPITLAAGGLTVAAVAFWTIAAIGVVPIRVTAEPVEFAVFSVPTWAAVLFLGLVTAAAAYVTGIYAARHLGSRLASFVALSEVAAGVAFAWLLLDQVPTPLQLLGALLILGGVVVVKLGERSVSSVGASENLLVEPLPADHPAHDR